MKKIIFVLFIIFLLWMIIGNYLIYINYPKAQIVMGLGVFYMAFILMPIFIYHRHKQGKYKKYQITDEMFKKKK